VAHTASASRPARKSASSAWKRAPWPRSASKPRSAGNGASASTATATTAIASAREPNAPPCAASPGYVGRFAPSPTGPLHLGSLVAAVGSFLDARSRGGGWLLRMEDLDAPRVIPGCADQMLRTLESFALHWDGAVEYQSTRTEHYARAQQALTALGLTFLCSCPRRELTPAGGYAGTCRDGARRPGGAKLAKSRRSVALDPTQAGRQLHEALLLLGQDPPVTLKLESPRTVLDWACAHWSLDRFHGVRQVRAAPAGRC